MSNYLNDSQLPVRYTNAGIVPINTVLFDWDLQDMGSPGMAIQITALGTTGVITPEFSCDEVNWYSGWAEQSTLGAVNVATLTATGLYNIPKIARFARLRMSTATTAGATTLAVTKSYADFRTSTASGSTAVAGVAAHDAVISGNPVRIGARAVSANYVAVASGDAADLIATLVGAQITKSFSIPELDWQYPSAGAIVDTADVVARASAGAGIRNYVTAIQVRNTSAVATEFVIKEGAAVIWRTQLPAAMVDSRDVVFPTPLKGAVATAINIACITTGAAVYANLQGFAAP